MKNEMSLIRQPKAAANFLDSLLKVGRVGFSFEQLMKETGLSAGAAKSQLHRLGKRVAWVPSARSFYLNVTPEHQAQGAPPVEWWLGDYFAWLGRPYYLALQSAAGAHGSNPQAIQVTQVMTDKPRKDIQLGRLKIVFFVKQRVARTPTQEVSGTFAPMKVSTPAATAFDLVRYAPKIGGVGRTLETLRPLFPLIRGPEIKAVLDAEGEIATAQRLGFLVEKVGQESLAKIIDDWLPGKRPVTTLAPGGKVKMPVLNRWRVFDNSGEFSP